MMTSLVTSIDGSGDGEADIVPTCRYLAYALGLTTLRILHATFVSHESTYCIRAQYLRGVEDIVRCSDSQLTFNSVLLVLPMASVHTQLLRTWNDYWLSSLVNFTEVYPHISLT